MGRCRSTQELDLADAKRDRRPSIAYLEAEFAAKVALIRVALDRTKQDTGCSARRFVYLERHDSVVWIWFARFSYEDRRCFGFTDDPNVYGLGG